METSKSELENLVESILFVAGQGVEIKDIAEKLEIEIDEVKTAVENLKEKHKYDGFKVITFKDSAQLCSNEKYAEDIATVLNPIREKQLTKAALEALAIIAYKQPVTRLDIEQVRGVNSDYAVQVLESFKLVEVVGRKDAVGKPLLFGTTDEFLKRFDLQTIDDLPDYEELLERIKILHEETNEALYKSTEIIAEEDLPDHVDNENKDSENLKENEVNNSTDNLEEGGGEDETLATDNKKNESDLLASSAQANEIEDSSSAGKEEQEDTKSNEKDEFTKIMDTLQENFENNEKSNDSTKDLEEEPKESQDVLDEKIAKFFEKINNNDDEKIESIDESMETLTLEQSQVIPNNEDVLLSKDFDLL